MEMESLAVSSSAALIKSPPSRPLWSSLSSSAHCSFRRLPVSPNKHKVHATMTTNLQSPTAGKVITCKAAVSWKAKEPLVIEEIQVAPPMPGEVRIKILYTSLCHTDVTFWLDKSNLGMFPRIFGHEAAGIVESVGEGVTDLKVGDHVLPIFTGECKNCIHCRSAKSNICETLRIDVTRGVMLHDKKSRFSIKGKPIHFFLGSTFSQYTVVESGSVVKVDPEAPLDKICILSCGVTTGMGSVFKAAKMESGSTVAVFGLGTIGLAAAEAARIGGASRIIGVDTNSDRFERARKFGCTEFVNPKDHVKPVEEVIKAMTNGGVDYSFECVGNSKVCESALLCCHDGWGLCVITGVEGHANNNAALHPGVFLYGRTLTGAFFGGLKPKSELPQFVDRYMRKEYEVEKFITHTLPFTEINEAIRLMMDGESLRCVMDLNL